MTPDPPGGTASAPWDPDLYARFRWERAQPFHDLLARIPAEHAAGRIADLGCGDAQLTVLLARRWPRARVLGVDRSAEMLERATGSALPPNLALSHEDIRRWAPDAPLDLILSNAALHWVPDHGAQLARLTGFLGPGGILAVQIPNSRSEPAHRIIDELCADARWSRALTGVSYESFVESPGFYVAALAEQGLAADVWETIYFHRMAAPGDIAEWLKGTTLRPILAALTGTETETFTQDLTSRLAEAYPAGPHGVVFPFRRIFFVGRLRA